MKSPTSSFGCYSVEKQRPSSVIKTEFEKGYIQARERFTRDRCVFVVAFPHLKITEKDAFEAHFESVRQSGIFEWTNTKESKTYQVRYKEIPTFKISKDASMLYETLLTLEEV